MEIKRTNEEIQKRYDWLLKAVDDENNQDIKTQCKLWSQIDFILWLEGKPISL